MGTWLARIQSRSLAARVGLLGIVSLGLYALAAPVGAFVTGPTGLWAATAAGTLCFAGAALALVASHLLRGPQRALIGLLVGMALRFVIPLGGGAACHYGGGSLAEAGILYYLLVFYPITLGVETVLSLPPTDVPARCPETSPDLS
ncbi:MAG: hypothetical protein A2V70_19405 [Planctomycetes bacterium RBG_13_63_9]|nr:MAG: hypothetical protein A2V70_19405 [Planctomycetes bacterium RBG_13_63_9]